MSSPRHRPVSSGPGLSLWAILTPEKQELSSVISVPSVVKTKSSLFSVFLAEAGWLGYPQERAGRAPASMADSWSGASVGPQTSEDILMSNAMSDANPLLAPMKGTQHQIGRAHV